MIADCELKSGHVLAGGAAMKMAQHLQPADEELRQSVQAIFGPESRLPVTARKDYSFQGTSDNAPAARRTAWNQALAGAATGKLGDAARAFEQLANDDANDAPAWYNLALARAWLGENKAALDALERYLAVENDEARATDAAALAEILHWGRGMESQSDYVEDSVVYQVLDPQALSPVLEEWQNARRIVGAQVDEEQGILTGLLLENTGGIVTRRGGPADATAGQLFHVDGAGHSVLAR